MIQLCPPAPSSHPSKRPVPSAGSRPQRIQSRPGNHGDRRGSLPATGRRAGRSPTPMSPRTKRCAGPVTGPGRRGCARCRPARAPRCGCSPPPWTPRRSRRSAPARGVSGIHLLHGMRPGRRADHRGPRAGAPAVRPPGLPCLPASPATGPGSSRAAPWTCCRASRTAATTSSSATATAWSSWTTSLNRCACCAPAGWSVFEGVFANGRTVDSGPQPTEVLRLRELLRAVRESQELVPSLLPVGDGLLCAVKR